MMNTWARTGAAKTRSRITVVSVFFINLSIALFFPFGFGGSRFAGMECFGFLYRGGFKHPQNRQNNMPPLYKP
jgi:hypothetical protein